VHAHQGPLPIVSCHCPSLMPNTTGFQPAVSPTSSRHAVAHPSACGWEIRDTAGWKPALRAVHVRAKQIRPALRGAEPNQNFSVGVKDKPRSPLKSRLSRRSLELRLRRMTPGATRLLISRRNRRPLSQSSQLIEPSIGMQGILDFEFIGNFLHQFLELRKITVFRQIRNSLHFPPAVPHGGSHGEWGCPHAGKIGGQVLSWQSRAPPPVAPVHTSSVKVRRQVFEVSKNRRPKAGSWAHPLNRGRSKPCSTAR